MDWISDWLKLENTYIVRSAQSGSEPNPSYGKGRLAHAVTPTCRMQIQIEFRRTIEIHVIHSPVRIILDSPMEISWAAFTMLWKPEPHNRFTVNAGRSTKKWRRDYIYRNWSGCFASGSYRLGFRTSAKHAWKCRQHQGTSSARGPLALSLILIVYKFPLTLMTFPITTESISEGSNLAALIAAFAACSCMSTHVLSTSFPLKLRQIAKIKLRLQD